MAENAATAIPDTIKCVIVGDGAVGKSFRLKLVFFYHNKSFILDNYIKI